MREQEMTLEEAEIVRQAAAFFANHCNPPPNDDPESLGWWEQAAQEVGEMNAVWNSHELMIELLVAYYRYISNKVTKNEAR